MSKLPSNWFDTNLGVVVDYGRTEKIEPSDIAPNEWVLELEDIEKNTSRLLQTFSFSERSSKSAKNRFAAGDVLYGKLRPNLNKVILAEQPGVCSTEILPLRCPEGIEAKYVFFALKRPDFLDYVTQVNHGNDMPRLGTDAGRVAAFPLSPTNEQRRIVAKLDILGARSARARDDLKRIPILIERYKRCILAKAFSGELTADWRLSRKYDESKNIGLATLSLDDQERGQWSFSDLPEGWTWVPFSEFFSDQTDSSRKLQQREYATEGSYPVIDQGEMFIGGYTSDDSLLCLAEPPIVLFGDHTRCVKFIDFSFVQGADGTKVLKPNPEIIPRFAYYALMAIALPDKGYSRHMKFVRASYFPKCELEEQAEIVRRIMFAFDWLDKVSAEHARAQRLLPKLDQAILAKAFRGQLVPQDPNDEPASELLKRIKEKSEATVSRSVR